MMSLSLTIIRHIDIDNIHPNYFLHVLIITKKLWYENSYMANIGNNSYLCTGTMSSDLG